MAEGEIISAGVAVLSIPILPSVFTGSALLIVISWPEFEIAFRAGDDIVLVLLAVIASFDNIRAVDAFFSHFIKESSAVIGRIWAVFHAFLCVVYISSKRTSIKTFAVMQIIAFFTFHAN